MCFHGVSEVITNILPLSKKTNKKTIQCQVLDFQGVCMKLAWYLL